MVTQVEATPWGRPEPLGTGAGDVSDVSYRVTAAAEDEGEDDEETDADESEYEDEDLDEDEDDADEDEERPSYGDEG